MRSNSWRGMGHVARPLVQVAQRVPEPEMEPLRPARLRTLAQQPDRGTHLALVGERARGDDPALGDDLGAG